MMPFCDFGGMDFDIDSSITDSIYLDYENPPYINLDMHPDDLHAIDIGHFEHASRNPDSIFAQLFKPRRSLISFTGRTDILEGLPQPRLRRLTIGDAELITPSSSKTINGYLPSELLREIFLYSIKSNNMRFGHLASVCCYWRSVIITMSHLWSTLRVVPWTGKERVTTWLQRAYPKKVVLDLWRAGWPSYDTPPFSTLRGVLTSTDQWHELTISSFPPETLASRLGFQGAMPMKVLRALHVEAGCVHSPSFTLLLDLVPTDAPLSELRLHPSFASAHFLQPPWFPALQNLTVLIVNGRDIYEPFDLLPSFTRLQTFEADHLHLPWYEPDTKLPLLLTLQKLQFRATSVQWMAGRQFPCLQECAILLPRHWGAVQQHEVQFPSCKKLIYHGYPMTTVEYFRVPNVKVMELRSNDPKKLRVYQQLRHLCTVDGRMSKLVTLHLTFQCSEQALIKVLKYFGLLQELVLSTTHPSPSWQSFLHPLVAKPSKEDWPDWSLVDNHQKWERWCSSQTWYTDLLPNLKSFSIQCANGFSRSECLNNGLLFRLVGWTRAQMIPPLGHLNVWEGRRTITKVDYISTDYPDKHPGMSRKEYDSMIIRGMVTRHLVIQSSTTPLFALRSTTLFRQLQGLVVDGYHDHHSKIPIFPYLEQIKRLEIWDGVIPTYPLDIKLPLIHTLQRLILRCSSFSWVLGRTFEALREFHIADLPDAPEALSRLEGLHVGLPVCTTINLRSFSVNHFHFLSCTNVQILQWEQSPALPVIDAAALKLPQIFLCTCSNLQKLDILIPHHLGRDPLIQFVFCDALEQGIWQDITSVEVKVSFKGYSSNDRHLFFTQMVGRQQHFDKLWKEFTVTENGLVMMVTVRASM